LFLIFFSNIGVRDEEVLLFPLILVCAAVLLDWRSYVSFAGLVVGSVVCALFVLEATGPRTRFHAVVNVVNILVTTAVAVGCWLAISRNECSNRAMPSGNSRN